MKKERNSNFELLRIISMFLIVLHHFSVHGVVGVKNFSEFRGSPLTRTLVELLGALGKPAVILFVLISGFYLVNSKFKLERVIILMWKVFTYSVLILIIVYFILNTRVSVKDIITSFLPTTYGAYWFITDYVVLIIFSPFINIFMLNNSKRTVQYFLLTLLLVGSLVPTFLVKSALSKNEILSFLIFYCVGGYIRIYAINSKHLKKFAKIFTLSGLIFVFGGMISLNILAFITKKDIFSLGALQVCSLNSIFSLVLAIGIFLYVISLQPRFNKLINTVANSSLAVYIISDNNFLRNFIWQDIIHARDYALVLNPLILILYAFFVTSVIYAFCTAIDIVKSNTLDRWIDPTKWVTLRVRRLASVLEKYLF